MYPTPEEALRQYLEASDKLRAEFKRDPNASRQLLLQAGILVEDTHDPRGVALAPKYRSGT